MSKNRVIRLTNWIAGMVAVAIALIIPLGYFTLTYQYMVGGLESEAEINSRIASDLISENPEMWRYRQEHLGALLARRQSGQKEVRRIVDLQGEVIAERSDPLTPPLIKQSHELKDAGVTVGMIEISRSLLPILSATAMAGILGIFIGFIIFIPLRLLPVREVIRAEKLVHDAQVDLVRSEKLVMLGRIAANMGNELRNPLGVMSNAVFFLKSVYADADKRAVEYLDIIKQEIDNSLGIISDLLDFCSINTPLIKPISVHELIKKCLGKCDIPENIQLRFDIPEISANALIDPKQMEQVLKNLVTNAVQAMPAGGALRIAARRVLSSEFVVLSSNLKAGTLDPKSEAEVAFTPEFKLLDSNSKLKTKNSKLDGDFIEISITDTGEGIAPENIDKLFQPLFTTKSRGIGLGLAISHKLTEANGGRIEVASELRKGTSFTVILPAGN